MTLPRLISRHPRWAPGTAANTPGAPLTTGRTWPGPATGVPGAVRQVHQAPARGTHLLPESPEFTALPAVLATGYLVGIVEWACMRAVSGHLDDGEQTLGVHADLSHQAPTLPGDTLTVTAELTAVDGRQLTFTVTAADEAGKVCQGTHRRAVIDRARFDGRLAARRYQG